MPVPSCVRARVFFTRWKRSNIARQLGLPEMPMPVSAHRKLGTRSPSQRSATRDLAVEGELERVGQEIEDDLLPHVAIDVAPASGSGGQSTTRRRPAFSMAERNTLASSAVTRGEVRRLEAGVDASGLDAREVEQRVHQLQQPQAVAVRDVQRRQRVRRQRGAAARAAVPRAGRASASAACGIRATRSRRTWSWRDRVPPEPRPAGVLPRARARRPGPTRSASPPGSKNVR